MDRSNFFILTGGPGSGKTTLIKELNNRGCFSVEDVARKVIQDEIILVDENDLKSRIERMIVRSIDTYKVAVQKQAKITIFDGAVLDYIGYADRTNTSISEELKNAALSLVYSKKVFIAPTWKEIYCNDSERIQSIDEAIAVYNYLFKLYLEHGYEIIKLPQASIECRADFVMNHIVF